MKTISKRFLKASLAMLLAVIMLFGSTITGFAAVVDNADTKAQKNMHWQGKVYFLAPESWDLSTYDHIQVDITRTQSATVNKHQEYVGQMQRIGDSRLFFIQLDANHNGWNQDEFIAFTANEYNYGSGTFTLNTNHYYTTPIDYGCNNSGNFYVFKPNSSSNFTSTTNGNVMSGNWGSTNTIAAATQTAQIYTNGSSSANGGKVSYNGLNFSSTSATTSTSTKTGTSSSTSVSLSNAVLGSSMSFTATPNNGYKFDGWYSASTGGTLLSSSATYTYNVYEAKTVYARFSSNGYSYTVSAGEGGTVSPTSGTATSVEITATPETGYEFDAWEYDTSKATISNDAVNGTYGRKATFTLEAATGIKATFKKIKYEVKFLDGTTQIGTTQYVEHGGSATAPTLPTKDGYTSSWDKTFDNITENTNVNVLYTANDQKVYVSADPTVGGSVKINGADVDFLPVKYDDEVTVLATANKGYDFIGWYNGNTKVSDDASYEFTCTGDVTLVAKFKIQSYTIKASASNADGGTVTIDGEEVDSVNVEYGNAVSLEATAKLGYDFRGWKRVGNDTTVDYNNPLVIEPDSSAEFIANFVKVWKVEVVLPEGASSVKLAQTVTATPSNYKFTFNDGVKTTPTVTLTDDTYEHRGWKVTQNGKTTTHTENAIEVTINSDTTIEPIVVKTFKATSAVYTTHVKVANGHPYGGTVSINNNEPNATATVDRGSAVKYVAEPYTNYEFIGWYNSEKDFKTSDPISTNLEYTLTESAAGDMHLVALFARIYKVSGAYNGTFKYNSKTNTYSFVADNYSTGTFNILSANGSVDTGVENGENTLGGTLDGTNSPFTFTIGEDFDTAKPITFELTSNNSGQTFVLDITAQYRNAYNVTFASNIDGEGAGSYLAGKPVLLKINCDVDQAIAGFSFKTGNGFVAPSDATKVGDKQISFTMPEGDVELDVDLAKMYKVYADTTADTGLTENAKYYLPGEDIVYPLTPTSAKVSIMTDTIALVPRTEFTSTLGANGVVNLLFTMPNEDVKVQAVTKTSYQVNVVTDIKDYFDTNGADYCSVEVKAFGITDDNYVANNTTVTLKATSKQGNNQDYTFLGYYDNEGKLISENPVYSFIPQDDINYKAVFVRNVYIVGDIAEGEDVFTPMEYDMDTDTYSYAPDIANGSFKITPIADPDSSNFDTEWNRTSVEFVGVNSTTTKGVLNGLKSNYTMPLSITFSKANVASYRAQVSAKEVAANVYLSSGRLDYDRRKSTYFSTNTQFIDYEGEYTVGEKQNAVNESYIPANLPQKNMTVRVQTTISGSTQNLYDVEYFYIYDVESGKPSAVAATPLGGGVYEASIEVKGTSFIVPLFFANQNYLNAVGGKRVQIYVDPREIIDDTSINWGKFMACYPYGRSTGEKDDHDLTGHWPGQLMIPLDDGTFKTSVVIGDGTNETLSGLVFNNYLSDKDTDKSAATLIKSNLGMSGIGFVQTYDYREAVYLDKGGFDVITYKLKKNNDGYHGNRLNTEKGTASGSYRVNATTGTTIKIDNSHYKFAPLMDRHNRYPMDFNGVSIKTANPTTAYYVVAEGDVTKGLNNSIDAEFSGDWTVLWHIYDSSGKFITSVFSGSMYHKYSDTRSRLAQALGVDNTALEGKQVMITYEAKNKTNYYRVDGQWYGEKTAESNINASVIVGLYDGANFHENILDNPDTPNINENYGQAFINHEGGREQSVELKYVTGSSAIKVDLSAERFGNYKIKGWYTKNANGDYVEFQKGGSSASLTIGGDTVIYAFFEPLAGDQLVVDHEIYSNTTDLEILSGNGTGERTVEIWSYDPVTKKAIAKLAGSTSINGSSASTAVKENESYLIRVKVNPLGADKFHAWYMAAERADGTSTFEEVFTDGSTVNSENEVVSEFVYTFKPNMPTHIVIYSDLKEISVNGKLIYIYKNRYGNERFITQTIKMTPEEIDGFAGNDNKSRLPAYKNYLIYEKVIDGILVKEKVYTQERADELLKEDYEIAGDGNQIGEYLPNLNVTEAVNISTEWFVDEKYYTFKQEDSIIEIRAEQNPLTFHLTATVDGETYTKSGPYNSLIEDLKCSDGSTIQYLDAPLKNKKGESFSYWQSYEEVAGVKFTKIISYSPYYRYRLIEDRTIEAVYGEDVTDAWTPSIEDVTYTREYGDGGDYIYTDYLVAFHSSIDEKLEDIKKDTTRPFEFGLVLIRDPKVTVTDDNYKTFSDYPTYDGIENDVKAVAEGGTSIKVYDEKNNNKDYNAYYFEFSDEPVTNFNRLVHAIKYDNKHKNNYKSYAFSAYAYLIIDGHTYISTPENVNFYELAIEKVTDK